jgi:hypothetical protein
MQIPNHVLIIGVVSAMTFKTDKSKRITSIDFLPRGKEMIIATNKTHTQLYIFENIQTGVVKAMTDKAGHVAGYIHQLIEFELPQTTLKKVGNILSIQYRTVWWEGVEREYRHEFNDAKLYANAYSRFKTMGIKPKHGKILTEDGITG